MNGENGVTLILQVAPVDDTLLACILRQRPWIMERRLCCPALLYVLPAPVLLHWSVSPRSLLVFRSLVCHAMRPHIHVCLRFFTFFTAVVAFQAHDIQFWRRSDSVG